MAKKQEEKSAKINTKSLRNQSGIRRLLTVFIVVLIAGISGFLGGRLGHDHENSITDLSGQRQIVTSQGQLINSIAKQAGPSVVSINVTTQSQSTGFFDLRPSTGQAAGTGIILSKDGVVMTNRHVVPVETTDVTITLSDGTQFDDVEVIGRTHPSDSLDIAFLKIQDLDGKQLTPAQIGRSSDAKVGDAVVAIGNALGRFQNTVTSGIISGFGRQVVASSGESNGFGVAETEDLGNLIQTDAAINQGNSGGPLVNMNGQVIGVNTAVADQAENIGFAIPIDDVRGLIDQVLETGSFTRPYLGIRYIALTSSIAEAYALSVDAGAYIAPRGVTGQAAILRGSPADKAGLEPGDIIRQVNGVSIDERTSLTTLLNKHQPGETVKLNVLRDDKTLTIGVTLGRTPSES